LFPTPFNVVGGSASFERMEISECPYCGGSAYIPDGVYKRVGDAIALLSAPEVTLETLQRLQQIFVDARENTMDVDIVAAAIKHEVPSLRKLAEYLPKTPMELSAYIALMLTALTLLFGAGVLKKEESKPSITINNVFEQVVQPAPTTTPASAKHKPYRREVQKVKPNDPCPCKSGKKFKKCHGDPRSGNPQ
jgi:hypothetical protein